MQGSLENNVTYMSESIMLVKQAYMRNLSLEIAQEMHKVY